MKNEIQALHEESYVNIKTSLVVMLNPGTNRGVHKTKFVKKQIAVIYDGPRVYNRYTW